MSGPLIRGSQCAVIDGHVDDAVAKGAKLLCGKTHKDQYYWPTVLSGITPDMRIFHEESFGPVTSIIKVRDHEEALELANATDFGLSSGAPQRKSLLVIIFFPEWIHVIRPRTRDRQKTPWRRR